MSKQTNGAIQIEKNVPMPPTGSGSRKYPFHEMEVGDSFRIAAGPDAERRVRSAACYYGSRHNLKFSVRRVDDGLRVWRVE